MIGYFERWEVLSIAGASYHETSKRHKQFGKQYAQGIMTFRGKKYLVSVSHLPSGEMLILHIRDEQGRYQRESERRVASVLNIIFHSDESLKKRWLHYNINYFLSFFISFILLCTQCICLIAAVKLHTLPKSLPFLLVSLAIFIIQKCDLIRPNRF